MSACCPICDSTEVTAPTGAAIAFALTNPGSSRDAVSEVPVYRCGRCAHGWQHPLPDARAVAELYADLEDERYLAEEPSRERAADRALDIVESYASPSTGPLLDVGCSAGLFLARALARGWDAWGVEPSAWLVDRAIERVGARVRMATLESTQLEERRFGVVTAWDVLEHVVNPHGFLLRATALLAPRGWLLLKVPAIDSLLSRALGARWPLRLPEHLHYFSLRSMDSALHRAGLVRVASRRHRVEFSIDYVLHRLSQHRWPLTTPTATLMRAAHLHDVRVPLWMGERVIVARRR